MNDMPCQAYSAGRAQPLDGTPYVWGFDEVEITWPRTPRTCAEWWADRNTPPRRLANPPHHDAFKAALFARIHELAPWPSMPETLDDSVRAWQFCTRASCVFTFRHREGVCMPYMSARRTLGERFAPGGVIESPRFDRLYGGEL